MCVFAYGLRYLCRSFLRHFTLSPISNRLRPNGTTPTIQKETEREREIKRWSRSNNKKQHIYGERSNFNAMTWPHTALLPIVCDVVCTQTVDFWFFERLHSVRWAFGAAGDNWYALYMHVVGWFMGMFGESANRILTGSSVQNRMHKAMAKLPYTGWCNVRYYVTHYVYTAVLLFAHTHSTQAIIIMHGVTSVNALLGATNSLW